MQLIEQLKRRLESPLPGWDSQFHMAPFGRQEFMDKVLAYRKAAVLSLVYPKNDLWHMVFIERSAHEKDKHSAQISFPGGSAEEYDQSVIDTALREAHEEIGLDVSKVNVLAELTPLKIPVSKFEVFPVLAYSESELIFTPQVTEVARIIEVPIQMVVDPVKKGRKNIRLSNGMMINDVPIFNFDDDIIWGATSMMLNEIIEILT
ncbi:NUDIX hydrolase [Portibacter lacus]|uniref:Coenzyme A pyrophosphatase n=1 Tax=Portibacter lacus TaxID=1099794 RepID=A0AA37SSK7_9BACT|nr:CoA pyrophosphatase [Portibacter lacus]GLR18036.1 coenzyme A pyrophosphatase [Portibacter lacus]